MDNKLRRALELGVVIFIIALSVVVFLARERLQNIGSVGYVGLFALCALANATVMLPSPSLMIAASCALILDPLAVAAVGALGSAVGELVGYAFGAAAGELSPKARRLMEAVTARVRSPELLVFILAALPLPLFDIAGVVSGGGKMKLMKFFALCFAGKLVKMLVYVRGYDMLAWSASHIPGLEGRL